MKHYTIKLEPYLGFDYYAVYEKVNWFWVVQYEVFVNKFTTKADAVHYVNYVLDGWIV
jgi:hypothetical protein